MATDGSTRIDAPQQNIASDARFGRSVHITCRTLRIDAGVAIDDGVVIEGGDVWLEAGSRIGAGTRVAAARFQLGYRARIDGDCKLGALSGQADEVRFGDHALLGGSSVALVPVLLVGDYTKIHNHALINGFKPCYVGHNSWVGQNCVLNANDTLFIGNNVGIGTYSSVWTHAFFGQMIEGFTVNNTAPVVIEDDAWLVGAYNVVSPGLSIGARAMVLTSSVVSKSVAPEHTVGGAPARDMTERLPPVRPVSLAEKLAMMRGFIDEFVQQVYPQHHARRRNAIAQRQPRATFFDLATKRYTKRRTDPEIQIIAFMNTYRARFVPVGQERVGVIPELPPRA